MTRPPNHPFPLILLVIEVRAEGESVDTPGEGEDSMNKSMLSFFLVNLSDGGVERFVSKRLCARLVTGLMSVFLNGKEIWMRQSRFIKNFLYL